MKRFLLALLATGLFVLPASGQQPDYSVGAQDVRGAQRLQPLLRLCDVWRRTSRDSRPKKGLAMKT